MLGAPSSGAPSSCARYRTPVQGVEKLDGSVSTPTARRLDSPLRASPGRFSPFRKPMDEIRIEALELSCIVGVRRRERRKKQLVRLDLTLGLDVSKAGQTGRIALTCDYSRVADEVTELLRFRAYRLIEVATEELAAMLFGVHPMLQQVDIRLEKPGALANRARS